MLAILQLIKMLKLRTLGLLILLIALFAMQPVSAFYNSDIGRWANRDPIGERGGLNLFTFAINNPLSGIDLFGLSAQDVQRIKCITGGVVGSMNDGGLRRPGNGHLNADLNNIESFLWKRTGHLIGNPYYGCGEQSDYVADTLVANSPSLDDNWNFSVVSSFVAPDGGIYHQFVVGTSSNPGDPTLTIDPWNNSFTENYSNPGDYTTPSYMNNTHANNWGGMTFSTPHP